MFMKIKRGCCLILPYLIFFTVIILGQQKDSSSGYTVLKSQVAVGGAAGLARNLVNQRVGFYFLPNIFVEYSLSNNLRLVGSVEYFQTKYEYPLLVFQYMNTEYQGLSGRIWKNYSFNLGISYNVSNIWSIGVLAGIEKINIKEVNPEWKEYRPPFEVNPYTDKVSYYSITTTDDLLIPGLIIHSTVDLLRISNIVSFINLQYKLEFVGKKYGGTAINTQDSFLIGVGIKYQFYK